MSKTNSSKAKNKEKDVFLWLAVLLALGAMLGFYLLPADKAYFYILSWVALVLSAISFSFSMMGRRFFAFSGEAYREMQKVVWPSGKETWQTTLVVFFFVFVVAVFLWLVDKVVEWGIFSLILGWK
jgi:preprotein translocase subunit SecE